MSVPTTDRVHRVWILAAAVVTAFVLLAPGLAGASGPSGALVGYVTDASSGAAISGASVEVQASDLPWTFQVTTDASGHYAVSLPNHNYAVTVSASAYYVNATSAGVGSGQTTWFNVSLRSASSRSARIQGYVTDSITSGPVTVGRVLMDMPYYYSPRYSNSSTLDATGYYRIDLVPGTYTLSTEGVAGYLPYAYSYVYPYSGSVIWYNFTLTPASLVSWINGTVEDSMDFTPIAGATVSATVSGQTIASATSNATGQYSLHVPVDTFILVADAPGYAPDTSSAYVYYPGSFTANLYLLRLASGVRGFVVNGLTGAAIPNALVVVSPFWSTGYYDQAKTTATGSYAVSLPADDYDVGVSATGFTSWTTYAFLSANEVTWLNLTLWPIVAPVKGYVIDGGTGLPLSGQYVYAYDARSGYSASATTDGTGLYSVTLPPSPAISLRVYGYAPYEGAVVYMTTRPYVTTWMNITLPRLNAQLAANVTDATTGLPLVNAVVSASWGIGSSASFTSTSGIATVSVPAGLSLTVSASATGHYSWYGTHAAVSGSASLSIQLYPTLTANVTVQGYVKNSATNTTLSSVWVQAKGYGTLTPYDYTDGAGFYTFSTVPAPQTIEATEYGFTAGTASVNPAGGSTIWVNLSLTPDSAPPQILNFTAIPAANVGPASPTSLSADINESSLDRVRLSVLMQVASNAGVGTFMNLGSLPDDGVSVTATGPRAYAVASSWDTRMMLAHLQDNTWNTWWPATPYGPYQIYVYGYWSNATLPSPTGAAALFDTRSGALLYLSTSYGVFGPQDQPTSTFTPYTVGIQVTLATSAILGNLIVTGPVFQPGSLSAAVSGAVPGGNYAALLEAWDSGYNYARAVTLFQVAADTVPPVARAGPDQTVNQGATVTFDGTASTDNVGIATYTWSFTDGTLQVLHGAVASYTFSNAGSFPVTLTIDDGAGNTATDTMTVTVRDTTSPIVAISAPAEYANVSGSISVTATASDNVGVVRVQFLLDGNAIGNVTAAPFTISLDTRTLVNGNHTITAVAFDAAGNSRSAVGHVTVYNVAGGGGLLPGGLDLLTIGILAVVAVAVAGALAAFLVRRRRPRQPVYPTPPQLPAEPMPPSEGNPPSGGLGPGNG